ncbi:MAG: FAD-dependent oxidoreductase [Clostridia bacterium]|nr:FAD-dependent oxidoreductase [Clostridia bacterium]
MSVESKASFTGEYDVIICGGRTSGCVAAIAAARMGAKTLLRKTLQEHGVKC